VYDGGPACTSPSRQEIIEEEYKRILQDIIASGDTAGIVKALNLIPDVIQEIIEEEIGTIKALIERLESMLRDVKVTAEENSGKLTELNLKYAEINRKLSHTELTVGALAEALLSKITLEELVSAGYNIMEKTRNHRVDNEDIDLLVAAEKKGVKEHFLVEVKVKPRYSDVGSLLAKRDLYEAKTGIKARPILAGIRVDGEIEAYAKSKNVEIIRL